MNSCLSVTFKVACLFTVLKGNRCHENFIHWEFMYVTLCMLRTYVCTRHAEIHRTSDNDEKNSQCPINVGKTPDKMSGISIYPKFVVKSQILSEDEMENTAYILNLTGDMEL